MKKRFSSVDLLWAILWLCVFYYSVPVGTLFWTDIKEWFCASIESTSGICSNIMAPTGFPVVYTSYHSYFDMFIIIIPLWIIIWLFWFFLIRFLCNKIKKAFEKPITFGHVFRALIYPAVFFIIFCSVLILFELFRIVTPIMDYKIMDFWLDYEIQMKRWPFKILFHIWKPYNEPPLWPTIQDWYLIEVDNLLKELLEEEK